jgi:predicted enzyme related to lactoylglutathione lyase
MKNGITGLGGIFFKSKDPKASMDWYAQNLGLEVDGQYGTSFSWLSDQNPENRGYTVWSRVKETTDYFKPAELPFMVNFRVANLEALLVELAAKGIQQIGEMQAFEYGKFAWIMDPNGVKIELWEPNDEAYNQMAGSQVHKT